MWYAPNNLVYESLTSGGFWGRDQASGRPGATGFPGSKSLLTSMDYFNISPTDVLLSTFLPTNLKYISSCFFLGRSIVPRKSWGLCSDSKIII